MGKIEVRRAYEDAFKRIESSLDEAKPETYRNAFILIAMLRGIPLTAMDFFRIKVTEIKVNENNSKFPILKSDSKRKKHKNYHPETFPIDKLARKVLEFYCKNRGVEERFFEMSSDILTIPELIGMYWRYVESILIVSPLLLEANKMFSFDHKHIKKLFEIRMYETKMGILYDQIKRVGDNRVNSKDLRHLKLVLLGSLYTAEFSEGNFHYECSNKECGEKDKMWAKSRKDSNALISGRDGLCLKCLNERTEKKAVQKRTEAKRLREQKKEEEREQKEAEDNKIITSGCHRCGTKITETVKLIRKRQHLCKDCSKKRNETKKFYKDLGSANNEVLISKVRVFGQGRYENLRIKKTNVSNRRWQTVNAQALNSEITEHYRDRGNESIDAVDPFQDSLNFEAMIFCNTQKAKEWGMTEDDIEELVISAEKYKLEDKTLSARECIKKATSE